MSDPGWGLKHEEALKREAEEDAMTDKLAKKSVGGAQLSAAFSEALQESGFVELVRELDHRMREQADAHHKLMALASKVDETYNRLENVHREHMGVMLDVQRQQQSRAALEERARQQGYLDAMGYERNAAWGMARLEAGMCAGTSKDMQRCTLKAKHDGDCDFPKDDPQATKKLAENPPKSAGPWQGYR